MIAEESLRYRTDDARVQFDRWSSSYDRDLLQNFFFRPAHEMLLETLGHPGQRVLDVGCGTGAFAGRLLERFPDTEIWGLDLSSGMLCQAQSRPECAAGGFHLVQGDSGRLPFADDTFDAVSCVHSFHHYPRQRQAVAEMQRVLRPGGRLLIIDGDRDGFWGHLLYQGLVVLLEGPVRHLTSQAFRDLYWDTGFSNVRQRRRGGPLPFLMTVGESSKLANANTARQVA